MDHCMGYREVIPDLSHQEKWNEITLNTGGTQSTLQDIKVGEKAGGCCLKNVDNDKNRFIFWRTYHDFLELSEISLDLNLFNNNIRYKFTDAPVLSVTIIEEESTVTILITTVSSLHRIELPHPNNLHNDDSSESKCYSIFQEANVNSTRDPTTYYVIGQATSSTNPIPHTANSCLSTNGDEAYFGLAYQSQLTLYSMNCRTGHTITSVLKEHYIVPRIISNLAGALRGKPNTSDSQYASSIVFCVIRGQTYLVALYRDNYIRIWSTTTQQCVSTLNCIEGRSEQRVQGPQMSSLRKIDETKLCAFLCQSNDSEFVKIRIDCENGNNITLQTENYIRALPYDLIDFGVTSTRIWALWCNAEGELSIYSSSFNMEGEDNWKSSAMEAPPDQYSISLMDGLDVKQAYCSYIFHPGKFDKSVIAKALNMFRRSNVLSDANIPMSMLKDRVCQTIENEIQNDIKDFDVSDDDYIDISTRLWQKFYSCCEQYHLKASQPIGLVLLNTIGAVCVVKKNTFSLLRPCETLEHIMLSRENSDVNSLLAKHFPDSEENGNDAIQLIIILSLIEQWLSDSIKVDIDKKLYYLEQPEDIIENVLSDIQKLEADDEIILKTFIKEKIALINNLESAVSFLLESLRMGNDSEEVENIQNASKSSRLFHSSRHFFTSNIGTSVISESMRQIALIRYSLCRNLLMLLHVIEEKFESYKEVISYIQAYYFMVWMCETPIDFSRIASLEASVHRLNLLQLTQERPLYNSQMQTATLMRLFLSTKGLSSALVQFAEENCRKLKTLEWQNTLLPILAIAGHSVWPISNNFILGEWLFGTCQHAIIQEYVRLLSWCPTNKYSRNFILATSLLDTNENLKAYELFVTTTAGVLIEPFLYDNILKIQDEIDEKKATAQLFLKIIQLFEQHSALDYVISLAETVIGLLEKDDPQLPMFQSIVFNNHLILEHYIEAYDSLLSNEPSRRKDCLRQLIMRLFEQKRFDLLLHFGYIGLQEDFESIIESRARSMSIEDNDYYLFLYVYHIEKENMRKASVISYEEGMRCLQECYSIDAMQRRYECLLACINCLNLVEETYRWIVKPVDNLAMDKMETDDDDNISQQMEVLELDDIKRELLLTEGFLSLANYRQDICSFLNISASEMSIILANNGLFSAAIKLAKGFGLSLVQIFDALAASCVRTADENPNESWAWLQENDLANLPQKNSAPDMAWLFMKKLVEDHEEPGSTDIRKAIVNKILSLGVFVPQWLHISYKETNPAELLRLYVFHGRLIEAADFAKDYLTTTLEDRYKNISYQSMCIPVNSIDLLLHGLKLNAEEDDEYIESHDELAELVNSYVEKVAYLT